MTSIGCVVALLLLVVQPPPGKDVATEYDKKADFTRYRTYVWQKGHEAIDRGAHTLLVAEIERALSDLGLRKEESGQADVTVTYHTLRTAEVNLKELEQLERQGNTGPAPTYDMGKLVSGSHGTLAGIVDVTFKLMPIPRASATLAVRYDDPVVMSADVMRTPVSALIWVRSSRLPNESRPYSDSARSGSMVRRSITLT